MLYQFVILHILSNIIIKGIKFLDQIDRHKKSLLLSKLQHFMIVKFQTSTIALLIFFYSIQKTIMGLKCFIAIIVIIKSLQIEEIDQIINGKFTNPGLPNGSTNTFYSKNIEGWSCTSQFELIACQIVPRIYPVVNQSFADCRGLVVDLNSRFVNQELTQILNLTEGNYSLSLDYMYSPVASNFKQLQIMFNGDVIFSLKPNISYSLERYSLQKKIVGKDGINILTIKQNGINDGYGFKISNVSMYKQKIVQFKNTSSNIILQNTAQNALNSFIKSQILQKSKSVPGGRVFLFNFLSFMVNFDRLEFYLYHNRQYSKNAQNLLEKIKSLQQVKGNFVEEQIKMYFPSYVDYLKIIFNHIEIKKQYINYNVEDEQQKHETLPQKIHYALTYSVSLVLIVFLLFHICFRFLQRWSLSIVFRPYAFYATLIFALLEGNIESITFLSFGELQTLFAFGFYHKLLNALSVAVLFFVLFASFGLCLWLKFHHHRKTKILIDTEKSTFPSVLSMSFDRGMVVFALGAIHQLLLSSPNTQICALIGVELVWLAKKAALRMQFANSLFFVVSLLESLLRLFMQVSSLFYSQYSQLRMEINDQYHFYLIFGFIGVIALNFVCSNIYLIINFFMKHICKKNRIKNRQQLNKYETNFRKNQSYNNRNKILTKAKIQNDKSNKKRTKKFLTTYKIEKVENKSMRKQNSIAQFNLTILHLKTPNYFSTSKK